MKKFFVIPTLLVLVLAALLVSGLNMPGLVVHAQTNTDFIEPGAGSWKTWVLNSGSELRPAAPPDHGASLADLQALNQDLGKYENELLDRVITLQELIQLKTLISLRDAAALDRIAFWDTGAPTYRWNEMALNQAAKNSAGSLNPARVLALVTAAMYDATIAAYDAKYTYNRLRPSELDPTLTTVIPNPRTPAYPSEHAAVAGAASTVLAYLYPDDAAFLAAQAEAAAQSRLLAGVEYPSDVAAGLALGRAVGAQVIERAKGDGSDAKWAGSVPTEAGKWTGTNPINPALGTWKTWVLASGSELRPPAPLAYDSPELKKEMADLVAITRTPKQTNDAFFWEYAAGGPRNYLYWNDHANRKIFEYGLDANGPRAARVLALESIAYYDSVVACWDAKYEYWAIRPFQLDPEFKPQFTTPNHPSYPSAHSCLSSTAADTLAYLFPRDAQTLQALADQAGESRIWSGIHFRSDVTAGLELGRAVAKKAIERAGRDGSQPATAMTQ